MKLARTLLFLLVATSGCSSEEKETPAGLPTDWRTLPGRCVTYHVPPEVRTDNAYNPSTCGDWLEGDGCRYGSVFGLVEPLPTNVLESRANSTLSEEHVDGRDARVITYDESPQPAAQGKFGAEVYVAVLDADAPRTAFVMSVSCTTRTARDRALLVLRTLHFESLPEELRTLQERSCDEADARPLTGYALGGSCVGEELPIASACALDARANGATGNGIDMCFVSDEGDYYVAFVQYGETVVRGGTRSGPDELTADEVARCAELTSQLQTAEPTEPRISNRPRYVPCP